MADIKLLANINFDFEDNYINVLDQEIIGRFRGDTLVDKNGKT